MRRVFASLWACVVICAMALLAFQLWQGVDLRSDLTALIPQEDQNGYSVKVNANVSQHFSKQISLLLGHKNKAHVYAVARTLCRLLKEASLLDVKSNIDNFDNLRQIGALYAPHRFSLLNHDARKLLHEGRGQDIVDNAFAQFYSVMGASNARGLQSDPFNLTFNFLSSLPKPETKFTYQDGFLNSQQDGITWVLIAGTLRGEPYALETQDRFDAVLKKTLAPYPDVTLYKNGALFYAQAGAEQALNETTLIGGAALLSTIFLLIFAFRSAYPLLLSVLVIAVGFGTAFSFSLWFWNDLHVCALLFGISLIGVTVDYSLEYCTQIFSDNGSDPLARLKNVFSGLSLGAATTIIGYITMLIAPFPGLRQIALFSVVGSLAAWLCVVLWFPYLDRRIARPARSMFFGACEKFSSFWEAEHLLKFRYSLIILLFLLTGIGAIHFKSDDDVRKLQAISPELQGQEDALKRITGNDFSNHFIVVQGDSEEAVLQKEEAVAELLYGAIEKGVLGSFQALSSFVPSIKRQDDNYNLIKTKLYDIEAENFIKNLGLQVVINNPKRNNTPLLPALYQKEGSVLPFLSVLRVDAGQEKIIHLILLEKLKDSHFISSALDKVEGAHFVDIANDYTQLFTKYRMRALMLLGVGTLFMLLLLMYRYGVRQSFVVLMPPVLAIFMTPFICALFGNVFTFFDAIALLLVLSMGLDYSIFYKETDYKRRHVTLLAIFLSACTTMMSFGFLSFSSVMAVSNFGATMFVGTILSFILAPLVRMDWHSLKKVRLSALLILLSLSSCASQHSSKIIEPVFIAPNLSVQLPAGSFLSEPLDVVQNVVATYGNKKISFQGRIQVSDKVFKLLCFDPLGQRVLSAHWTAEDISFVASPWLPASLKPENILTDLFLIYAPEKLVRLSLGQDGVISDKKTQRLIIRNGKTLIQTDYANHIDKWGADIHHKNNAWGYELSIQSKRIEP